MVVVRRRSFDSYRNYLMDKEQGEKHPIKGSLCSSWWIQIQIPLTNNILCDSRCQPVHIREILPLTQETEVFLFPHPTLFSCSTMAWGGLQLLLSCTIGIPRPHTTGLCFYLFSQISVCFPNSQHGKAIIRKQSQVIGLHSFKTTLSIYLLHIFLR